MPTSSISVLANLAASAALVFAFACSSTNDGGTTGEDDLCADGACDDPGSSATTECRKMCGSDAGCFKDCRDGKAMEHCEARESDALNSAQQAFRPDAIRWACADVEGVTTNNRDDRGQEYCEYFAVVQPPPAADGKLPQALDLGRNGGSNGLSITLTADQLEKLEAEPEDAVVGQCVFTSWHQDIKIPLPVCGGSDASCPLLSYDDEDPMTPPAKLPSWTTERTLGIPLSSQFMKMNVSINSNNAAADLFEKCLTEPLQGDASNKQDPLHRPYIRGCMKAYELFQTEWRRSDPSVCTAGTRLAECGCGVDTNGDGTADVTGIKDISRALVPFQPDADGTLRLRGFHLGTWSDKEGLPDGCHHINTGDTMSTKTLVSCNLTAADLISSAKDPKAKCREKYGENVVVHVPVPAAAVVCSPPADGQYSATCGAQPWVLGGPASTN